MNQPPPTPNAAPPIHESVIADLRERAEAGRAQYGTYLQPHNGRDSLRDWYEELLDAAQYAKQAMMERDAIRSTISNLWRDELLRSMHRRIHSDICGETCCNECVAYQEIFKHRIVGGTES